MIETILLILVGGLATGVGVGVGLYLTCETLDRLDEWKTKRKRDKGLNW